MRSSKGCAPHAGGMASNNGHLPRPTPPADCDPYREHAMLPAPGANARPAGPITLPVPYFLGYDRRASGAQPLAFAHQPGFAPPLPPEVCAAYHSCACSRCSRRAALCFASLRGQSSCCHPTPRKCVCRHEEDGMHDVSLQANGVLIVPEAYSVFKQKGVEELSCSSCRTPLSCRRCQMRHHRRCPRRRPHPYLQMALQTWAWRAAALLSFIKGATPTSSLCIPMAHDSSRADWPASCTGKATATCHILFASDMMPA